MKDKDRFLDFPIVLLKEFLDDYMKCLSDIYCYAVFKMVYSEEARFEDLQEFVDVFGHDHYSEWTKAVEVNGRQLYDSFVGTKHVWTGIHIETWLKFMRSNRSEFDIVCLLAYLSLKSIVQMDKLKFSISNEFLMSRMAGSERSIPIEQVPITIQKHLKNKSRKKSRLFEVLEDSYGVVRPSGNTRGIVCSLTLSKKELELEVLKRNYQKSKEFRNLKALEAKEQANKEFEEWKKSQGGNLKE